MYSYGIEPDYVDYQIIKINKYKELKSYTKDTFEEAKRLNLTTWLNKYLERLSIDKYIPTELPEELRLFYKYPISKYAFNNLLNLNISNISRKDYMNSINPKFILRNHVAQRVIEKAEKGDYDDLNKVLNILLTPFDEHDETVFEGDYDTSILTAYNICVSCSS